MAVWTYQGAQVVEMEAATILQVAERRGVRAACVLGVSDAPAAGAPRRISADELEELGLRVGRAGYSAMRSD